MTYMKANGRPRRADRPQRMTLHLSLQRKAKLFRIAAEWGCSMSKVVETLIGAVAEAPSEPEEH